MGGEAGVEMAAQGVENRESGQMGERPEPDDRGCEFNPGVDAAEPATVGTEELHLAEEFLGRDIVTAGGDGMLEGLEDEAAGAEERAGAVGPGSAEGAVGVVEDASWLAGSIGRFRNFGMTRKRC
jgi:hypothetical protein